MSAPTYVDSKLVPVAISTDNITYKNVLCKRTSNFSLTSAVNAEESDCGISKGLGSVDWTQDFEGLVNITPNGATEMSASDILTIAANQTLAYIKWMTNDGTGKNLFVQGQGYITDFGTQLSTGNLAAFTFTFNGVGAPDITV
jgi:hypothetical protein